MSVPAAVSRCVTHHGCPCREWANESLPEALDALDVLCDWVDALERRSIRSSGEFHVWAEERMLTEARDNARALLNRLHA